MQVGSTPTYSNLAWNLPPRGARWVMLKIPPHKPKLWLCCNNRVRSENYNAHSKERSNSMAVSLQLTEVWCYDESVGVWVSRTLNLGFIFKVASTVSWLNFGIWCGFQKLKSAPKISTS